MANMALEKKLDEEAAYREARRREREEQHLYLGVRVITDDSFRAHGGIDLTNFDQSHDVEPAAARAYRLLRKSTIRELVEQVGEDTGIDSKRIRFWCMVNRQNKTTRPDQPITEPNMTIEDTYQKLAGNKTQDLRLWAEVAEEVDADGEAIWPQSVQNGAIPRTDLIVIFLKWFDVENQLLTGVGYVYISREKKVEELVPLIMKRMGWPEKSPSGEKLQLRLYEVSKASNRCHDISNKLL